MCRAYDDNFHEALQMYGEYWDAVQVSGTRMINMATEADFMKIIYPFFFPRGNDSGQPHFWRPARQENLPGTFVYQ